MVVIYRVCDKGGGKSPIYKKSKFDLVKMCFNSFITAFDEIKPRIIFVLDEVPRHYLDFFNRRCHWEKEYTKADGEGNFGTYKAQLNIAKKFDDYVMIQEDDFLYLPHAGRKIQKALEKVPFVTPQDEYMYYHDDRHKGKFEIKVIGDHHWREANSTTLTFGTHPRYIKGCFDTLTGHGLRDFEMWQEIRRKHILYSPIPTLAAHMVENILPHTIDWDKEVRLYET